VTVALVLTALFLFWLPTVYAGSFTLGTLLVFGAFFLTASAVLLVARGGERIRRLHALGWGIGGVTVAFYAGALCVTRIVGIGRYHPGWHWFDFVGIGLAVLYWVAGVDLYRAGGPVPPPYPQVDERAAWQSQQESDAGARTTYR
jgi:MFS family permease